MSGVLQAMALLDTALTMAVVARSSAWDRR